MPAFSPQRTLKVLSPATNRRIFKKYDPAFDADWKDSHGIFAATQASDAYLRLPKDAQQALCLALRDIDAVSSSPHGIETMRELLRIRGRVLPAPPPDFADEETTALVFLDHPDVWDETIFFVRAESVPERTWHEYGLDSGCTSANESPTREQIRRLEAAIRDTWTRSHCGLGRHIEFDYRVRSGSVEYLLGRVTTFPRPTEEYEGDEFVTRVSDEVKHIAIIFDRRTMIVRVGTSVPYVRVPAIADNWGRCVKGVKVVPSPGEDAETILERLRDESLEFTPDAAGRILNARRRLIWIELLGDPDDSYAAKSKRVDALDKLRAFAKRENLQPDGFRVVSAELEVAYLTLDGRRDVVAVSITDGKWRLLGRKQPSWLHDLIRERLVEWGVIHAVAA